MQDMSLRRRSALSTSILAGLVSLLTIGAAAAQSGDYPNRPVKVIVSTAPGGGTDAIARSFSERLTVALGQPFTVENRSGAAGAIGGETVAKSLKDGYTLLVAPTSTVLIVPNLRPTPYGLQDFVAIARMADAFSVIGASISAPFRSIRELVEYGRKNPGKINYASAGIGSIQHLRLEAVNRAGGIGMVHVPYRGTAEALSDLLSGQVEIMTEALLLPQIRAGKVQGLAFMDDSRHPEFPDMPTMKEASAGLPFENLSVPSWFMLFAPVGTPDAIVRKLNAAVVTISRDPELRERMFRTGYRLGVDTPEELAAKLKVENRMYADLIRDIGMRREN